MLVGNILIVQPVLFRFKLFAASLLLWGGTGERLLYTTGDRFIPIKCVVCLSTQQIMFTKQSVVYLLVFSQSVISTENVAISLFFRRIKCYFRWHSLSRVRTLASELWQQLELALLFWQYTLLLDGREDITTGIRHLLRLDAWRNYPFILWNRAKVFQWVYSANSGYTHLGFLHRLYYSRTQEWSDVWSGICSHRRTSWWSVCDC